ncbi:MAG: PilZ domain-containing protein [Pseudomonadota bacterium]
MTDRMPLSHDMDAASLGDLHSSEPASEPVVDLPIVLDPIPNTGRRTAPRLRLSLRARLVAVEGVQECLLINISRSGAQVVLLEPLKIGEAAQLICGDIDDFVLVTRQDFRLNGVQFEEELPNDKILQLRTHYETFDRRERRDLINAARKWVSGEDEED